MVKEYWLYDERVIHLQYVCFLRHLQKYCFPLEAQDFGCLQSMADGATPDGIIEAEETFFAISNRGNQKTERIWRKQDYYMDYWKVKAVIT